MKVAQIISYALLTYGLMGFSYNSYILQNPNGVLPAVALLMTVTIITSYFTARYVIDAMKLLKSLKGT